MVQAIEWKKKIKLNKNELNQKYQIKSNMRICKFYANMKQNYQNSPDYQIIQVMPLFDFSEDGMILKCTATYISKTVSQKVLFNWWSIFFSLSQNLTNKYEK